MLRYLTLIQDFEQDLNYRYNYSSPQAYFDFISPRNACAFDSDHELILQTFKVIASRVPDPNIDLFHKGVNWIFFNDPELALMAEKNKITKKNVKSRMIAETQRFELRVQAFEVNFKELVEVFEQFAQLCYSKCQLKMTLVYDEPALMSPILMLVHRPNDGIAYRQMTTLNCHAAALILKLAINQICDSKILIFDSLDYIIEPLLIR